MLKVDCVGGSASLNNSPVRAHSGRKKPTAIKGCESHMGFDASNTAFLCTAYEFIIAIAAKFCGNKFVKGIALHTFFLVRWMIGWSRLSRRHRRTYLSKSILRTCLNYCW